MSSIEFEELGRTYYKKKQYEKAVEVLTNGIEAALVPTVSLYDYRAASYEKLKDFNAAVKDGREAIRFNKRDVRGYLRTASVLIKMNKLDTALNIYKYGIKNVPVDNKDFKVLQQLHDQLTRRLSPANAVDPFTRLPFELVEMIVGYLPFRNLVNCLRVSKGWKNYLTNRPKLWIDLDLSGATKPVSRTFIRHAISWGESNVRRVKIHRFQHTDVLRNIATTCKNLEEMEILSLPLMLSQTLIEVAQCATNLKKLVIHHEVTLDDAGQILRRRPTLEHVEFTSVIPSGSRAEWEGPFPYLNTLRLSKAFGNNTHGDLNVWSIVTQSPALQSLTLSSWGSTLSPASTLFFWESRLTSLVLKDVALAHFPTLPSTLKRLLIHPSTPLYLPRTPVPRPPLVDLSLLHALRCALPHLAHIVLREMVDVTPAFLVALLDEHLSDDDDASLKPLETATPLSHFSLSCVPFAPSIFGDGGLISSSRRILTTSLQSLDVSTMPCTDDDIETLLSYQITNLRAIDMSYTRITGAGVKILVDSLPDLRSLNVDYCRGISSRDAIVYAEKRGIVVSCKMESLLGGRKVRYG